MGIVSAAFLIGTLVVIVASLLASRHRCRDDATLMGWFMLLIWGLGAVLHGGGIRDAILDLSIAVGGLVAIGIWQSRPRLWVAVIALGFMFELLTYAAYWNSIARGQMHAGRDAALSLNAAFVIQLMAIGSGPIIHGLRRYYELVFRRAVRGGGLHNPSRVGATNPRAVE